MALPKSFKNVTCKKCGWVAFAVPRKWAEAEVASAAIWLNKMAKEDPEGRACYGDDLPTITRYEHCWCGNSYKNFRAFKKGDCPDGCTLSSIIRKQD